MDQAVELEFKDLILKSRISSSSTLKEIQRKRINLEFSINRLLRFIDAYELFISQGEKYYQKFQSILNNYRHMDHCVTQLPHQYADLESEISSAISKFKSAYRIAELQGTKLRDLLYGVPQ